jgi:serine phosphatase RsbU (regulator of sigma subunit)/anti-anti-sigma regulatory factor
MTQNVSEGPCVLVVDDDPVLRRVVSRGLEPLALGAVVEVEDGAQAQEVLRERKVDVVITDVLMPNMDGRELMGWAKEHCPEPVWIVLSGLDTFDAAIDALHLGAFDFLAKPPEAQRLRVAVRNALGHGELLREKQRLYGELEVSNVQLQEKVGQLEDLCRILGDQAEVIQQDLERAEVIQRALLPHAPPTLAGYSATTLYRPGRHVGGDFYEARRLDDRHVAFVIADAAGHGVAAAMLSVLLKHWLHILHEQAGEPLAPCAVLEDLNARLLTDVSARGLFVTAVYALLDTETGKLRLASAGHPPVVCVRASGAIQRLERAGPALGLYADSRYEETLLQLEKGDRVFFYTDGLLAADPAATAPDALAAQVARRDVPNTEILRLLQAHAEQSEDAGDRDDITLMLLEVGEGRSQFDVLDAAPAAPPRAVEAGGQLSCGETPASAFIHLAGRVTWVRSQLFHDAAMAYLEGGGVLTLDLSECEYLDSTLLGTIHEIVSRGAGAVRLQGVSPAVRQLFEEVSMRVVLEQSHAAEAPLPSELRPLSQSSEDTERRHQRVLRAHEVLASLSASNREQFRDVVKSLREELATYETPDA